MARAGLYVRVSTEEQAKEGFSVAAQLRLLQAFAVVKGCGEGDVENFVDDGYSGKNLRRPAIQRLHRCCQARRLDYVIVWRLEPAVPLVAGYAAPGGGRVPRQRRTSLSAPPNPSILHRPLDG